MLKVRTEVEICRRRVVGIVVEPHRQASLVWERAKIVAHDDDAPDEGCDGFFDCACKDKEEEEEEKAEEQQQHFDHTRMNVRGELKLLYVSLESSEHAA